MAFATIFDEFLDRMTRDQLSSPNQQVDLFTNNYVPDRADTLSAFTLAAYPGYAQFTWLVNPFALVAHKETWAPAVASFPAPSSGGTVNVYGFVVTALFAGGGGTPRVVMASQFSGAPIALHVGDPNLTFNLFLRWFDAH